MDPRAALGGGDRSLHGQPPYPYVVIRHFSAVYERVRVHFVQDPIESSTTGGPVLVQVISPDDGHLAEDGRAALVERLVELSRASDRKMCAVFGPAEAVYVEPDGSTAATSCIPWGGISVGTN